MDVDAFCRKIETLLDVGAGSVSPNSVLADFEMWDSMTILSAVAMIDSDYGVLVSSKQLKEAKTVADLAQVVAAKK